MKKQVVFQFNITDWQREELPGGEYVETACLEINRRSYQISRYNGNDRDLLVASPFRTYSTELRKLRAVIQGDLEDKEEHGRIDRILEHYATDSQAELARDNPARTGRSGGRKVRSG